MKVLRTKEIAELLNVSKPTACKLLHSGKIPKIQLSIKCIGAFKCDVEAFLVTNQLRASPKNNRFKSGVK